MASGMVVICLMMTMNNFFFFGREASFFKGARRAGFEIKKFFGLEEEISLYNLDLNYFVYFECFGVFCLH